MQHHKTLNDVLLFGKTSEKLINHSIKKKKENFNISTYMYVL